MTEKKASGQPRPGDMIEITRHRVGDGPRSGEILEVLGDPAHPHFRVLWEDGHESTFFPSSDAIVVPGRRRASTSKP